MFKSVFNSILWLVSVGFKFFRVVPGHTTFIVLSTLVSQVALIVAFFLPLKVLILLGSVGMPRYFPQSWQVFNRNELAIILSLSAVGFYIVYLIGERLVSSFSRKGAVLLVSRTRKITLFEGQEELAINSYNRFSRGLSGVVFFLLSLISASVVYWDFTLVISVYIALLAFFFWLVDRTTGYKYINWDISLSAIISVSSAVGFLLAFAYMVGDFILGKPPNIIIAIVCILIARQSLSRFGSSIVDFFWLYLRKDKVGPLFFYGQQFLPVENKNQSMYLELLKSSARNTWLGSTLGDIIGREVAHVESQWLQTRLPDVSTFLVYSSHGDHKHNYLLKLYKADRKRLGMHESSLVISDEVKNFPGFRFLGNKNLEGFICNVFEFDGVWRNVPRKKLAQARLGLSARLISIQPDPKLAEVYKLSYPLLYDRLDSSVIRRLESVLGEEYSDKLSKFEFVLSIIRSRMKSIPNQIVNPHDKLDMIFENEFGDYRYIHWGRWMLEPVGAGWPVNEGEVLNIDQAWPKVKATRKDLASISINDVKLSALIYQFDFFYGRQLYLSAIELIPSILNCIESGEPVSEARSI